MDEVHYEVPWYIIAYKMGFGLLESGTGLALVLFSKQAAIWYRTVVMSELSEDPHDLLARYSRQIIPGLLTHHTYLVLYLMLLGCAKIAGATGLVFGRNWGVDLLVGLTISLFPFQLIDLLMHPSFVNFLYITTGILIAMYLVQWRPHVWARRIAIKAHHFVWKKVD